MAYEYINLRRLPASRRPDWGPRQALKKARDYANGDVRCDHGNSFKGYCQHLVACCYGHSSSGYASAAAGWNAIPSAFKRYDKNPPAGAWAYYAGGRYGHVALVDVFGNIFTNDIAGGRYVGGAYGRAQLLSPEQAFGHRYLGWTWPYVAGPDDGRTPPKVRVRKAKKPTDKPDYFNIVDGWFAVTPRDGLNARKYPTTNAKVAWTLRKGQHTFIERGCRNQGRTWYRSNNGVWFAAEFLDREETIRKDRRDQKRRKK